MKINKPKNHEQCSKLIEEIGHTNILIENLGNELNDRMSEIQNKIEEELAPLDQKKVQLMKAVTDYCNEHRDELIDGSSKTFVFPGGKVSWRSVQDSIDVKDEKDALKFLQEKKGKYSKFIKKTFSLNKKEMLISKNRDLAETIPGVSVITTQENFSIQPNQNKRENAA